MEVSPLLRTVDIGLGRLGLCTARCSLAICLIQRLLREIGTVHPRESLMQPQLFETLELSLAQDAYRLSLHGPYDLLADLVCQRFGSHQLIALALLLDVPFCYVRHLLLVCLRCECFAFCSCSCGGRLSTQRLCLEVDGDALAPFGRYRFGRPGYAQISRLGSRIRRDLFYFDERRAAIIAPFVLLEVGTLLVAIVQLAFGVIEEVTDCLVEHFGPRVKHIPRTVRFKARWPLRCILDRFGWRNGACTPGPCRFTFLAFIAIFAI
mmetsp:Transcript_3740/g.10537  ORF Transcript_3740/g.10537 Transcript_3740/m.10537 type:complete len:265 (+) Transcript_3740:400-1194(+)